MPIKRKPLVAYCFKELGSVNVQTPHGCYGWLIRCGLPKGHEGECSERP